MSQRTGYRLSRLSVSGFRSIRETEEPIQLNQLNVLIGANGSGKSNFVDLLDFLRDLASETLQGNLATRGWANAILFMGTNRTRAMSIGIEIAHGNDAIEYRVKLIVTDDHHLAIDSESIFEPDESEPALRVERKLNVAAGLHESVLRRMAESDEAAHAIWSYLSDVNCFHFVNASRMTDASDANFYSAFPYDGSNLASFFVHLRVKFPNYYRRIVETVRMVAPFFDDFVLEPEIRNPRKMFLRWKQVGADHVFGGFQLSEGTLRFAALAALLSQPEPPAIIVIDEPEIGLHPFAINVLGGLLRSASVRTQVVVSTQSVTLLDNFESEDVIVVERQDDQSVFRRLDADKLAEWLEDYSIGELWEKNVLGGRPWT